MPFSDKAHVFIPWGRSFPRRESASTAPLASPMFPWMQISSFRTPRFGQFHQHFTRGFFVQKFLAKLFVFSHFSLYFFGRRILTQKLLLKCWWNWHLMWRLFLKREIFFEIYGSTKNDVTKIGSFLLEPICHAFLLIYLQSLQKH